ncbi:MAG: metallophosphoesterase [Clostridia bacterium]|nr:metallophosphoesterase [Clostridia bacterium]
MEKPVLRFNSDGHFKILMVSDFHLGKNKKLKEDYNYKVTAGLEALIEETKPDMVFFGGDQCLEDNDVQTAKKQFVTVIEPVLKRKLPWAAVFGNHDRETGIDLETEMKMYQTVDGCLCETGDTSLDGVGNYRIPILSSKDDSVAFNLFALDSQREVTDLIDKFGLKKGTKIVLDGHFNEGQTGAMPTFEQVMWYYNTSKADEKTNGKKIPAAMFMHIPLPEYLEIIRNPEVCDAVGSKRETVGCTEINFGLFAACLQRGDVKGIFFGHEHLCDIQGEYCGIIMAQDAALGYNMSAHDDLRGGRVIDLYEDGTIQTHAVKLMDLMGRSAMRREDYFEGGCKYFIRKL